jgi:TonB family protein
MRDKGAWYKEEWRKKVERIGNLNYPDEARRQQIYGNLRLMVSINRDGSLYEVLVLESSGQPLLDQAAQRIVRLAAPFAPFTGDWRSSTGWKSSAPGGLPVGTDCPATDLPPARREAGAHNRASGPRAHPREQAPHKGPMPANHLVSPATWRHTSAHENLAPATSSTSS